MTPPPSISVVIALYNKGPFIAATLASTLAQRMPALEIIVVDDGSTDGGAEKVEQFNDARIRLLRQANGGVSRARNAGIAAAAGDWVAFLDADDLWHPDYLQTLVGLIRAHPTVDTVATMHRSISPDQAQRTDKFELARDFGSEELVSDLPARWIQGACLFTSSVAAKRSTLVALQPCFPPGEQAGEDLDLWFRLGELGPIALSAAPLVLRLCVPGSLSSGPSQETELPYLLRMQDRALNGVTPTPLRMSTLQYVDDSRVTMARNLIARGDRIKAWPLLRRAKRHATPHRWALSLLMLLLPSTAVNQFQSWRVRRTMIL